MTASDWKLCKWFRGENLTMGCPERRMRRGADVIPANGLLIRIDAVGGTSATGRKTGSE